jgi:hypothetical protein
MYQDFEADTETAVNSAPLNECMYCDHETTEIALKDHELWCQVRKLTIYFPKIILDRYARIWVLS